MGKWLASKQLRLCALDHGSIGADIRVDLHDLQSSLFGDLVENFQRPLLSTDACYKKICSCADGTWRVAQDLLHDQESAVLGHGPSDLAKNVYTISISIVVQASSNVIDKSI